jgi:hypothetical protein
MDVNYGSEGKHYWNYFIMLNLAQLNTVHLKILIEQEYIMNRKIYIFVHEMLRNILRTLARQKVLANFRE